MTTFDEREQAIENKFAHDQTLRFKAKARRNKMLGLWASGEFGLPEILAEEYWKEVVRVDLLGVGDEHVFQKIRGDFDQLGIEKSDHQIRRTMEELMVKALKEIEDEG